MAYKRVVDSDRVRAKLAGIGPVLAAIGEGAVEAQIHDALDAAQGEFEETTHVWVWTRRVLTYPAGSDILGTTYDVAADPMDYYSSTYPQSARFDLLRRPIVAVQRMAVEYGPARTLITYPTDWLRINHKMGTVNVVPPVNLGGGGVSGEGSEYFLPLLRGGFLRGVTPLMVSIDYTAGIPDADTNPTYAQARECLAKMAAAIVRQNLAGMIANSAGRDGISASFDDNMTQIRLLTDQAAAYMDRFAREYAPVRMVFV